MMGVARMILVSFSTGVATSRILQKTNRLVHRQEGSVMLYPTQETLGTDVSLCFQHSMLQWLGLRIFHRTHSVGDRKL
jgi:hypothetical protein